MFNLTFICLELRGYTYTKLRRIHDLMECYIYIYIYIYMYIYIYAGNQTLIHTLTIVFEDVLYFNVVGLLWLTNHDSRAFVCAAMVN